MIQLYNKVKKGIKYFLPSKTLYKVEPFLRYFLYLFYSGSNYYCNVCGKKLKKFIPHNDDLICPRCGSLSRTRRLKAIIDLDFSDPNIKILEFSPSRAFFRIMKKEKPFYTASDLSGDFISDVSYNITNIPVHSDSYDLIICYHILEHVEPDIKAMSEMFRILTSNGIALIQTPFKEGEIYEDFSIKDPHLREIHFGQNDHCRIYSIQGLSSRLKAVGFDVEIMHYSEEMFNKNGFSTHEVVLKVRK
jgi:SAM-dependent methyltransferase